ncbi:lysozyme inhibitor LprI family protein [Acinetobacter sp. ANC 5378]|uniref:lysozyme inhibitor LprI family protein n=1 Tax=Acinetobacter sp. ANC 5378 TaxID=2731249 RepID=UPI002030AD2E|nr:lysozyme inhibitor LprI family protein [Acinetobacter sp. ANC 5378]
MKKTLLLGLVLLISNQLTWADEVEFSKQYNNCMDNSGGVTVEMLDCIGAETKRQDIRLNNAYKNVIGLIPPQRQKQLQETQRSWIKYRDLNCDFYADPNSGTSATLNSSSCFLDTTASRVKELEWFKEYYAN